MPHRESSKQLSDRKRKESAGGLPKAGLTGNKIRGKPEFNVQSGGKNYPATDPNFKPNSNPDKTITFPNTIKGQINVKAGGKEFNLSKEEYAGTFVTPQTMALDQELAAISEEREEERIAGIAQKEAKYNYLVGQELDKLVAPEIAAEREKSGLPPEPAGEQAEQIGEPNISQTSQIQTQQPQELPAAAAPSQEQIEQEIVEKPGVFGVLWNLFAGNDAEKNPFTNEVNIDPETGKPYQFQVLEFPLTAGSLAGAAKVARAAKSGGVVYNLLAKMSGWRSPSAAAARGWTPSLGQLASYQAKNLKTVIFGKTALGFLSRTSVVGTGVALLRFHNIKANANISLAEADMNDLIGFASTGMSYEQASQEFEQDVQAILNTRNSIIWLSKIPTGKFLSGAGTTLARIELLEKNFPQLREKLRRTSGEFIEAQVRKKYGI